MKAREQLIRLGRTPGEDRPTRVQPVAARVQRADVTGQIWQVAAAPLNVAERSTFSGGIEMWILFALASLVLATARPLAAQFPTGVAVGSRVRVMLPDSLRQVWGPRVQWLHGGVEAVNTDTLYLRVHATASPVAIPRKSIKRMERSVGVPTRVESGIRGAFAGAFWLGVIALVGQRAAKTDPYSFWNEEIREGVVAGALIGFSFGAIFPTERWRRIRLR